MAKDYEKDSNPKTDFKSQGKRNNKGRGGRPNERRNPSTRSKPNSADWYYTDTQYRDAVANLPINTITGIPLVVHDLRGTGHNNWEEIPGIMSIDIHESIGHADRMVDPVNQAAYKLWTFIRSKMSGATLVADAQDIMIYVLAVRSLYAWLSSLKKMYGLLSTFEVTNRFLPRYILQSEGWDYDDLLAHKPEIEAFINVSIDKANNMVLPSTMSIFNRTVFMSESVYMDSTSFRAQIYDFVWDNHYKYVWNGGRSGNGSSLTEVWTPGARRSTVRTYADIRTITNTMIDALFTNEDIGTISGYLLRAFENDRITLAKLDPTYTVNFVYSEEMLSQIQNMRCYGRVLDADIVQDPTLDNGTIKTKYTLANSSGLNNYFQGVFNAVAGNTTWNTNNVDLVKAALEEETIMVFHKDQVTPDDWLTSSRLTANMRSAYDPNSGTSFVLEPGSEYVVDMYMWRLSYHSLTGWDLRPVGRSQYGFGSQFFEVLDDADWSTSLATASDMVETCNYLAAYRFGPYRRLNIVSVTNGTRARTPSHLSQIDLDVTASVSDTNIVALHDCAILGEFKLNK